MTADADAADAPAPGRPPRRRRRAPWILAAIVLYLAAGAAAGVGVAHLAADYRQQLLDARSVTGAEQSAVDAAVAASADVVARIQEQRTAYRDAADLWQRAEASSASFHAADTVPTVSAPNPGGDAFPGGEADARALLDGIGGGAVRIVYDGGPQNCGFAAASQAYSRALGGCYDSDFRNSVFLAWDRGATRADVWPIFVHEAMHWYQWDRYATLFAAATASGFGPDAYRAQIESDASCRAVYQHGVPASAYDASTAPCDVDDWSDGWLPAQLAGLGIPVAAPDPEAYEVEAVTRP